MISKKPHTTASVTRAPMGIRIPPLPLFTPVLVLGVLRVVKEVASIDDESDRSVKDGWPVQVASAVGSTMVMAVVRGGVLVRAAGEVVEEAGAVLVVARDGFALAVLGHPSGVWWQALTAQQPV